MIHNKSDFDKFLPLCPCYFSFRERAGHETPDAELESGLLVGCSAEFSNIKALTLHQMSFGQRKLPGGCEWVGRVPRYQAKDDRQF